MAPKKGPHEKVEARNVLTAVVLADSFTQRFRPTTVERPKVLLPLLNVPMIEYTLEWLALNKVEEAFLFCCAHAETIRRYIAESKWGPKGSGNGTMTPMKVTLIVSTNCLSAGEALRSIDQRDIIKNDFVLVTADTVSNANLGPILEAHRARRQADRNAIMTMVMKPVRHPRQRLRLGDTDLVVVVDAVSNRLLKYVEYDAAPRHGTKGGAGAAAGDGGGNGGAGAGQAARRAGAGSQSNWLKVDASLFSERDSIQVRCDLMDTHICICAPEVLVLFSDNFDYQHLRRDFITGVLSEEELGNKLYIAELKNEYAARLHNLRSYDAISRDLMQRWAFPFVPDTNVLFSGGSWGATSFVYARGQRYMEMQVTPPARSAQIGEDVCIGTGTSIGDNAKVAQSVVGRNCRIGRNVDILGSYLMDNVVVQDNAVLRYAFVCERAVIRAGAVLEPGAVVSFGVVIGPGHRVLPNTRLSLCRQLERQGNASDDELEYSASGTAQHGHHHHGHGHHHGHHHAHHRHQGGHAHADAAHDDHDDDDHDYDAQTSLTNSHEKPTQRVVAVAETLALGRDPDPALHAELAFDEDSVGAGGAGYCWAHVDGFDVERFSIAPSYDTAGHDAAGGEGDDEGEQGAAGAAGGSGVLGADEGDGSSGSEGSSDGSDSEGDGGDPERVWKREVEETFLRCIQMRFDPDNVVIELNALKIAEDRTFADCARYMFTTLLAMGLPAPPRTKEEYKPLYATEAPDMSSAGGKAALLRSFKKHLQDWKKLLQRFLRTEDDQVELLLTLEEYCSEENVFEGSGQGSAYKAIFPLVMKQLYDDDVVCEEAFLAWADEKAQADEADRTYLRMSAQFIDWLRSADDDEEDDDDDEDEEDDD